MCRFKRYSDLSGLDWTPKELGLVRSDGEPVESHKALIHPETGWNLGIVGADYTVIPNSELRTIAEMIPGEKEAGESSGGTHVYATVLYNSEFSLPGIKGDSVRNRIHIAQSHDGSHPLIVGYTGIRPI